ncbi:hypothetical protein O0544_06405 [Edwardsiella anguillarum]|nr:hypothetical protein [Edwardsiella anguillarum]
MPGDARPVRQPRREAAAEGDVPQGALPTGGDEPAAGQHRVRARQRRAGLLAQAEGRIAAEGALPYPPGVLCVVPGEIWGGSVQRYFLALEEGINLLPGFAPELQGVYIQQDEDGRKRAYGYVIKQ